jgi:hypothetical protein
MSSTPAMAAEARITCSNCSRVIRFACFPATGRLESGVDSPAFGRFENTRERRRLPQSGHSFTALLHQKEDFFKRQIQNSAPFVEIRLGSSGVRVPAAQILSRDLDQFGMRPQLFRDSLVKRQTAPVYSQMS